MVIMINHMDLLFRKSLKQMTTDTPIETQDNVKVIAEMVGPSALAFVEEKIADIMKMPKNNISIVTVGEDLTIGEDDLTIGDD